MASVPNRANPLSEYTEIRTDVLRTDDAIVTTYTAINTTWSGSALVFASGSTVLRGFKAQGTIHKYQPVGFSRNTGSVVFVSGSTSWGQGGILGVSAAYYTEGQAVDIITSGIVPYITSGAANPTTGSHVIFSASGSMTGSTTYSLLCAIAPFTNAPGLTSGSGVIGIAYQVGAAAPAEFVQVWVRPEYSGVGI